MFSSRLAIADEIYGLHIVNQIVLFGPSVNLICKFKGTEMEDED